MEKLLHAGPLENPQFFTLQERRREEVPHAALQGTQPVELLDRLEREDSDRRPAFLRALDETIYVVDHLRGALFQLRSARRQNRLATVHRGF